MIIFNPKKISQRMSELDINIKELSEKVKEEGQSLDTARNFVGRVIHGKNQPTAGKLAKLAEALKTDVNSFFDGIQEEHAIKEEQEETKTLDKILELLEAKKKPIQLKDMNIDLEPDQRAIIVIHDKSSDNTFFDRAISLMQGVKKVVEVPVNGEKQSQGA